MSVPFTNAEQCKTYAECMDGVKNDAREKLFQDHDVLFTGEALLREYYVS